jgi:hypothetical protein
MSSEFRGKASGERHFHASNVTGVAPAEKGHSRPNRGVENGVGNGLNNAVVLIMVSAETRMNKGETPFSGPL